jgi:hypothetical protein
MLAETGVPIAVDRVEWRSIELDRVQLAVHLRAFAKDAVTLHGVRMERMSIGGIPFYAAPAVAPVVLKANEWTQLEPVPVTIYLRDLDVLAALRALIDKQTAAIRGDVRFSIELPLLARIFLFTDRAAVAVPVRAEVPFSVPGGALTRGAAALALSSAEKVWSRVDESLHKANPAVVPIETTYVLEWRDGRREGRAFRSFGALIAANRLLTTGETAEPWLYDPEVAAGIASGGAIVFAFETKAAGRLIKLLRKDSEIERVFVPLGNGKEVRVNLGRRATPRNAAIFEYKTDVEAVRISGRSTGQVSLYRLTARQPRAVQVMARFDEGRILLADPVASATGSLVFVDRQALGLMQDEWSAIKVAQIPLAAPLL